MDTNAVAAYVGLSPATIRDYHKKSAMPKADRKFGISLAWERKTIEDWKNAREAAK